MHDYSAAYDLLIVFGASTLSVLLFSLIRLSPIAGFILAGAAVGPYGFGLITDTDRVNLLAELGVVFLLFALGSEFSLKQVRTLSLAFFGLGGSQCVLTLILGAAILMFFGKPLPTAIVGGAVLSLSSTALVLKLLDERRESRSLHGQLMIAVLLFQDLWVVPIMASLPLLVAIQSDSVSVGKTVTPLLQGLGALALVFIGSRFVVGRVLALVAKTRVRELFLMMVFSLGVGVALLTAALGLSLALGAFLAGMMVSDSRFRHQAVADIIPLRDAFLSIFFVSVGMMLDASFIFQNWAWILAFSALILFVKFLTTVVPGSLIGYAPGTAALVALSLAQIGEFSLVVAQESRQLGLLNERDVQMILSCTLVLFLITPWVFRLAPKLAPQLGGLDPLQRLMRRRGISQSSEVMDRAVIEPLTDHVVIFGFGHNGEILAQTLARCGIPYIAVDLNPDNVVRAQRRGYPVIFGDGARPEVLHAASLESARIAVVTVSDPQATLQVLRCVRSVVPDIHVIARAALARELEQLIFPPPSDVVVAEIEAGVEIVGRVLMNYGRDPGIVQEEMDLLHSNNYQSIRAFESSTKVSDTFTVIPEKP